jgi:hypothetical protein
MTQVSVLCEAESGFESSHTSVERAKNKLLGCISLCTPAYGVRIQSARKKRATSAGAD